MVKPEKFTGVILAGGKSKRLGYKNKAFLQIGNKSIIERVIDTIYGVADEIILITNSPDDYEFLGLPMFGDIFPDSGSLGGIHTGLVNSQTHQNIMVACDMPFIGSQLLKYLMEQSKGYDIVVPVTPDGYHPLCAVYSKNCIEPAKLLIESKNLKIINLFQYLKVNKLDFNEHSLCYEENMFFNVNTEEDYIKAVNLESIQKLSF